MIYMLRGLFDVMCSAFTGGWWFEDQEPLVVDPVPPALIESRYDNTPEEPEDDGTPLPPPTGSDKPECVKCGDPNFSLESEICIACRIGMG